MAEQRNLKLDLFALALLAIVVFFALALVTYSPADPVSELIAPLGAIYQADELVYPPNERVTNACGRLGATIADIMLTTLGIGAYFFVISLAVLDIMLLRRRKISMPMVRGLGWLASLLGMTTISALLWSQLSPGPVTGSGGMLGTLAGGMLQMYFATIGSVILAASLLVCGLLLCTDYAIVGVSKRAVAVALIALRLRRTRKNSADAVEAESDEEDDELPSFFFDEALAPSNKTQRHRSAEVNKLLREKLAQPPV